MDKKEIEMKKFFGALEYDGIKRMLKFCKFMKGVCVIWVLILVVLYTVPINHKVTLGGVTAAITLPIHILMIAFNGYQTRKNGAKATEELMLLRYRMVPVVIADGMGHILPPMEWMEL